MRPYARRLLARRAAKGPACCAGPAPCAAGHAASRKATRRDGPGHARPFPGDS